MKATSRILLLAFVAFVGCGGGSSPTTPQAPTTRTVTLLSNDVGMAVPRDPGGAGRIAQSVIQVSGLAGTLTNVRVTVDVDQGPACELNIWVRHPDGTQVVLLDMDRPPPGFGCASRLVTTFPSNTLTPGDLSVFSGKPANGTWTLHVADERTFRLVAPPYILRAWSLELTVRQ